MRQLATEGTVEGGDIDPSKFTHADIIDLAKRYQDAVGVIDQQKRLLHEANRVIIKLQTILQELRNEPAKPPHKN